MDDEFMKMTCNFLNCIKGLILLKYLDLPVGANWSEMSTSY